MAPSHYLNHCWNILNWTLGNKLQWNFKWNSNIFIQENAFENVGCEMASIYLGLNVLTHWLLIVWSKISTCCFQTYPINLERFLWHCPQLVTGGHHLRLISQRWLRQWCRQSTSHCMKQFISYIANSYDVGLLGLSRSGSYSKWLNQRLDLINSWPKVITRSDYLKR